MRRSCWVAVFLGGCSLLFAQGIELSLVNEKTVWQRLEAGRVHGSERQTTVEQLFRQVGCNVTLQPVHKRSANVICTLPGETASTIVVGAHLDFVEKGKGIVDDWSGTSLLVSLYECLKTKQPKHTYQFVAFTREEKGLLGSNRYVKAIRTGEEALPAAMVNLECLGMAPPKVWQSRADPALLQDLIDIAHATRIPIQGVNVEKIGDDDTHPFLDRKVPVITIHSVTQDTLGVLHSKRDTLSSVDAAQYYATYRLVAFYLKYIDDKLAASGS